MFLQHWHEEMVFLFSHTLTHLLDHMRHGDFRVLLKHTGHQAITADIIYTLQKQRENRDKREKKQMTG